MSEGQAEVGDHERPDEKGASGSPIDESRPERALVPYRRDMAKIAESFSPVYQEIARLAEKLTLPSREIERMAKSLRLLDQFTPQMLRAVELGMSARIVDFLASDSFVAASRQALQAQAHMMDAIARPAWVSSVPRLADVHFSVGSDLVAMSSSIARLANLQALQLSVEMEASFARAMRSWNAYTRHFPVPQSEGALVRARFAGVSALGIAATVATIGGEADESRLAEPWERAPGEVRERMLERLDAIDSRLVPKLKGAWDRVGSPGPDGVSQCATSVVELIDWFLRTAAPEDEVLRWHGKEGRPEEELHDGRPTRALRAKFLLRDRQPDGPLASAYVQALVTIGAELQGMKHADAGSDTAPLARLLPTVEAVFTFVLFDA